MTSVLALDLGTNTGWAFSPTPGSVLIGSWNLKGGRFEGGGMRFVRFRKRLDELAESGGIDMVVFEEVRRHAGTDAAHVYGGLMATLTAWCEEREIPYEAIPIGTWKKFLTGKGNASKEIVKAAVEVLGYTVANFDEADAVGVLLCKREELGE